MAFTCAGALLSLLGGCSLRLAFMPVWTLRAQRKPGPLSYLVNSHGVTGAATFWRQNWGFLHSFHLCESLAQSQPPGVLSSTW